MRLMRPCALPAPLAQAGQVRLHSYKLPMHRRGGTAAKLHMHRQAGGPHLLHLAQDHVPLPLNRLLVQVGVLGAGRRVGRQVGMAGW